jgi:ParB/RepB/Spo0J family partition protein
VNSEPMNAYYEDKVVPISKIDITDHTFRLSLRIDPANLVDSIQAVGLINPPVVTTIDNSTFIIVCGFRRIKACQLLGWQEIKARTLVGDLSEAELLKLAISDNRSHRSLNIIEQARGIQKLSAHTAGNSLEMLSSLLGFPSNQKVFQKISALIRLPEVIQTGVLDNTISFEAAADLCKLSPEDALVFYNFLKGLKLSQNKQKEIITLVEEIGIREDLRPLDILESKEIRVILDSHRLNQNEKGSMVRACLKRRRFPTLANAQEKFLRELKALKLDEHMHITAPAYFEGGLYTLRMTFKSLKDLRDRRQSLDALVKDPAMKRVLKPYES